MTQTTTQTSTTSGFFVFIAGLAFFAIFTGFGKTFIIPLLSGSKSWPISIYIHAFFAFSWIFLFLVQSLLIKGRKYKLHASLGRWGIVIASGAVVTIISAGLFQVERELMEGLGQTAISTMVGVCSSAFIFLSFVVLAIYFRKKPQTHKRFMLLATIVLIWPAWFRWRHFFPSFSRPDIWFGVVLADSLIIIAFMWDWIKNRNIHPALLFGGLFFIIENVIEIWLFDTHIWRIVSNFLYKLFT